MFNRRKRALSKEDITDTKVASQKYFLRRKAERLRKVYFFLGVILFVILISFLLFHNFFDIQEINLTRINSEYSLIESKKIEQVIQTELDKKKLYFFSAKNIFLYNTRESEKKLDELLNADSIKIKKKIGFALSVEIVEKKPAVIFVFQNNYYYIDSTGNLIRQFLEDEELDGQFVKVFFSVLAPVVEEDSESEEESTEISLLLLNKDNDIEESVEDIYEGLWSLDFLLSKINVDKIDFVLAVIKELETVGPEIEIDAFEFLDPQISDIRVHTNQDYVLYFDQEIELDRQIDNLKIVLEQKLKNKNIKYIDLRYIDRIYYQD